MKNNNTNSQSLISAKNIGVHVNGQWLIRNVNLNVHRGEIVTIIGPNGGGKSTLVKALLGIIERTEGTIVRQDNLKIGYVPQKLNIDSALPLTVNRFLNLPNKHDKQSIEKVLERVGASTIYNKPLITLSGGEFQRALIARAIITNPQLLVLDEPVQGVDVTGESTLYQLIADVRDELNCGILMISHDLHIVMAQTDQVICLNGHVCCHGEPTEVVDDPHFKTIYGDQLTLALYKHHHDHVHH